jgi:hypothetical protein
VAPLRIVVNEQSIGHCPAGINTSLPIKIFVEVVCGAFDFGPEPRFAGWSVAVEST